MSKVKITITLDKDSIKRLDHLVNNHIFLNRSQAIQEAVNDNIERLERNRLAKECAKLDPDFEKAMSEEGTLSAERIGKKLGRLSPEELAQVVEGLHEIIAT